MNKKLATLGVSFGLAAGGVAGLAFGQPSLSGAATSGTTATAAADSSATTDAVPAADSDRPDPTVRLTEVLQPLVVDGTLTQAQLDSVVAKLVAAGPIGGGGHGPRGGGPGLAAAATALGVTEDELRTELEGGSSIADVATAKGVDVQTVIDGMVASATERISAKVADGSITQAEADTKLAGVTDRVTSMVNGDLPLGGPGGHGGRGPGADDAAPVDAATATTTG